MLNVKIPPEISTSDSLDSPIFFADSRLVFFRNRLFMPERAQKSAQEREEIVLRVKKAIYDKEAALSSLKAAVANIEAAIEYSKSGPRRNPILEDVKLHVWTRDGGACVGCGSKKGCNSAISSRWLEEAPTLKQISKFYANSAILRRQIKSLLDCLRFSIPSKQEGTKMKRIVVMGALTLISICLIPVTFAQGQGKLSQPQSVLVINDVSKPVPVTGSVAGNAKLAL